MLWSGHESGRRLERREGRLRGGRRRGHGDAERPGEAQHALRSDADRAGRCDEARQSLRGGACRCADGGGGEGLLRRRRPRRFRDGRAAGRQTLRLRPLPRVLPADAAARQALDLRSQRPRARRRHGPRPLLRFGDRQGGRYLRHARDQRRRLPLHDHVDHLPQRPAQEGQRDDAAGRAALSRAGGGVRAGQQGRGGGRVRRRRSRLGPEARLEEPGADAARPRRDVPPAGHGARRRARVPALTAFAHLLDGGHPGGRQGLLREARARMEGTLMAATDETRHEGEAPEAPDKVEAGEETGMKALTEEVHERRAKAKLGGGEEKIAKQHERGKLTARERIDLLCDPGTFVEMGIHGRPHFSQRNMEGKDAPADGVVTGWGDGDGRTRCIGAYDFTVMAAAMGMTGELKVGRLREMALSKRMPFIWLLDSAGARIQEAAGSLFAGSGHLFQEEVVMSGVIPMVAAMLGPCAAGTAYIPALSDFVPMVVGQGAMALAGPHLTKAVTGEDISMEDLGGAKVHCRKSGVGDLEVKDDAECIQVVKDYLSYFPANCEEQAPVREAEDPEDRMSEKLLDIVPESPRHPYDMYEVIREIVDDGEIFDIKPKFAKTIITCLARFGGQPVGIVANQPKQLGGILENDSADKAARFINLCDVFNIPLVFLQDVPGFMVGSKVEHAGIIRHGAKMLYAVSRATVPKVTVVVRKAYGAGYYVMNGRAYEPDLIVAWPSAEISVMGAEGAVEIVFRRMVEEAEDPVAKRAELIAAYQELIDVYRAARNDMVDDVIDPRETRPTVIRALELAAGKRVERPWRKHGVVPV